MHEAAAKPAHMQQNVLDLICPSCCCFVMFLRTIKIHHPVLDPSQLVYQAIFSKHVIHASQFIHFEQKSCCSQYYNTWNLSLVPTRASRSLASLSVIQCFLPSFIRHQCISIHTLLTKNHVVLNITILGTFLWSPQGLVGHWLPRV
jgi:hypothetical protein